LGVAARGSEYIVTNEPEGLVDLHAWLYETLREDVTAHYGSTGRGLISQP